MPRLTNYVGCLNRARDLPHQGDSDVGISGIALFWNSSRRVGMRSKATEGSSHTHARPHTRSHEHAYIHLLNICNSIWFLSHSRAARIKCDHRSIIKQLVPSAQAAWVAPQAPPLMSWSSHDEVVVSILYDIMCIHMVTSCVILEFYLHHGYATEYMATASPLW